MDIISSKTTGLVDYVGVNNSESSTFCSDNVGTAQLPTRSRGRYSNPNLGDVSSNFVLRRLICDSKVHLPLPKSSHADVP